MALFYSFGLHLLGLFYRWAAWFHPKAKQWVQGRTQIHRFMQNPRPEGPWVWFHCASLGEFEQGRPLMEAFRKAYPRYQILLTFFSPSGYEVRSQTPVADGVSYLPLDTYRDMKKFVEHVRPTAVFFVKYEFWPNLLQILRQKNIPTFAYSVILRPNQVYFRLGMGFFRRALTSFTHLFVQNKASQVLLDSIGFPHHTLAGDTRFDRVQRIKETGVLPDTLATWKGAHQVLVAGSIWPEDFEVLQPYIEQHPEMKFILAPHEWGSAWEEHAHLVGVRWSQWDQQAPPTDGVLWVDTMGQLSKLYRLAEVAYIGGAFGKGLHNTLEAAVFEIPILFGNKRYHKFQEALDLIESGAAFPVSNASEFRQKMDELRSPEAYRTAQRGAKYVVELGLGSTQRIMDQLKHFIPHD